MSSLETPPTFSPPVARSWHLVATLTIVVGLAVLLTGCATEQAGDQNKARLRDASKTAVIAEIQASMAAKPFDATPIPIPTPTPIPIIQSLTLSLGIDSGNTPRQQVQSFSSGTSSVYVAAQVRYLRKGEVIKASWRTSNDAEVASAEMTVKADADQQWVAFPLNTQLPPGEYAVYILANNNILNSLVFKVN